MDYTNHNTERWTNKYISLEDGFYIEKRLLLGASISIITADLQWFRTTI